MSLKLQAHTVTIPPLKNMKSKNIIITALVVIVSLVAGVGSFWLWQKKKSTPLAPTPTPIAATSPIPTTSSQLTPSPQLTASTTTPPQTTTPALDPFDNWLNYDNQKYQYQIQYDPAWSFNNQLPGSEKDDRLVLQGDIATKGWPSIEVNPQQFDSQPQTIQKLKEEIESSYGTWGSVKLVTFGNNIKGVLHSSPQSPQAYASKNYYFIHNDSIFLISLNDTGHTQADKLYSHFLEKFTLL